MAGRVQDRDCLNNVLLLVYFYCNFKGDKKADKGNCKYGIEGEQDMVFYRDKQIDKKDKPGDDSG